MIAGALLFVGVLAAPEIQRRRDAAAEQARAIYVVNANDVFLFDSAQSYDRAVELASRNDYAALNLHIKARGTPVAAGTRVRITHQNLYTVHAQAESGSPSGWTTKKLLTRADPP